MPVVASRARSLVVLLALGVGCAGKAQDVAPPTTPPPAEPDSGGKTETASAVAPATEGAVEDATLAAEPTPTDPYAACTADGDVGPDAALNCRTGALEAYNSKDFASAKTIAEKICTETLTAGCGLLGVLHAKGEGVAQDVELARSYLDRACAAKDAEACDNMKALDAAIEQARVANVLPVEGANVSIGSIGVDGLQATNLQCRREGGGGLFGGAMGAISGIAKRKKRLMACGSSPEDVRVRWTTAGGRIKTVEVEASSKKVSGCVKKALKGASAAFGGTCAATFSIGN